MAPHLSVLTVLLPLLAVVAPAAEGPSGAASSSCAAGGACEGSEDASLLQVQPKRHVSDSKESGSAAASLAADVWLTTVNSQAQATGLLVQGSQVHFQDPGARHAASRAAARGAAAAPEPKARLRALPEVILPTMVCESYDGAANRACVIVPPSANESFLQTTARVDERTRSSMKGGADREKYWTAIDGGNNRACRGDNPDDNSDSYFTLTTQPTLAACRTACEQAPCCTGIEYQDSSGRCELWTKKIQATKGVNSYRCEQWQPMSTCVEWDGITRVSVDASTERQTLRGFGAAMTQSSAYVLKKLKDKNSGLYDTVMSRLFGTGSQDAGISMVRFPIGSCDFSQTERTYADVNQMSGCYLQTCATSCSIPGNACDPPNNGGQWHGQAGNCMAACGSSGCQTCNWCSGCCCKAADYPLDTFALDPETETIVEVLQDAKKKNPLLVLMGSPWTPPAWLKKWGVLAGQSNDNTLLDGSAPLETYANYFLKTKTTFSERGLPLDYLTLQNEPLFAPNYPGMYLSSYDYGRLAAAVKTVVGDSPRILAYDHNWDHPEYALQAMQQAGPGVFFGTAFHCYAGSMSKAHSDILTQQPEDLEIMMTECTGSYPNSQCDINKGMDGFGWNHEWDMANLFLNNVLHGGTASVKWIMTLDENCGPFLPGHHFTWGRPLVSIPSWASTIDHIKFNQDFWSVAHMARFVRPFAKLVAADVTSGGSSSFIGAFTDESTSNLTLIAMNLNRQDELKLEVTYDGQVLSYNVPPWGTAVLRWPYRYGAIAKWGGPSL